MENELSASDCVTALLLEYQRLVTENHALEAALRVPEPERLAAYNRALANSRRIVGPLVSTLRDYARFGRWKQLLENLEQGKSIEKVQPPQ